jgi:hypothetical protein
LFGSVDFLFKKYYKHKDYNQLKDEYYWFQNENNSIIYEILATDHFTKFKVQLRNDLTDEFHSLQEESKKRFPAYLKKQYKDISEDLATSILNFYKKDTLEYIKYKYIKAGLMGIYANGSKADIKFAKKYLFNTKYGGSDEICLKIFSKYGNRKDAEYLLGKLKEQNTSQKKSLIKTALLISPGPRGIIKILLKLEDKEGLLIALDYYDSIKSKTNIKFLKTLLFNKNSDIRVKALSILADLMTKHQLKKLIDVYITNKTYFYDIVAWLDKLVYSPKEISEMYFKQLRNSLESVN